MTIGKLGSATVAPGATVTPYAVPPAVLFATVNFNIVNIGVIATKVRVFISEATTATDNDAVEYNVPLNSSDVLERTGFILKTGEKISVYSDTGTVVVRVMGIEEVA